MHKHVCMQCVNTSHSFTEMQLSFKEPCSYRIRKPEPLKVHQVVNIAMSGKAVQFSYKTMHAKNSTLLGYAYVYLCLRQDSRNGLLYARVRQTVLSPQTDCRFLDCGWPVLAKRPEVWPNRRLKLRAWDCRLINRQRWSQGTWRLALSSLSQDWRQSLESAGVSTPGWAGGHADTDRSRERLSKPSWGFRTGQHPDCLSHGNGGVNKFTTELWPNLKSQMEDARPRVLHTSNWSPLCWMWCGWFLISLDLWKN